MSSPPKALLECLNDLYMAYEDAVRKAFEMFDLHGEIMIDLSVKYLEEKEGK